MTHRLPLVSPGQELKGLAPAALERAALGCQGEDTTHHALVFLCSTLTRRSVAACIPPTMRSELLAGLDVAESWARGGQPKSAVRTLRAQCFGAVPMIERKTVEAVAKATQHLEGQRKTGLDAHAARVVTRYAALAAHYACSAVVLTLDTVDKPARAIEVPGQISGARAYQAAGLGAARFGEFRAQAWEQAEWEAAREGALNEHSLEGLALQIFHEFLGVRWKTHADLETLAQKEFIEWALSGAPASR